MSRKLQDAFFWKAKSAGFLARSAYKLEEIQNKYRVFSKAADVLDLGCSPGAWIQVALQHTSGQIVGVDIKECKLPLDIRAKKVRLLQADARQLGKEDLLQGFLGFHSVLSDMCHSTIGNATADAVRSLDLAETAAALALGTSFPRDGINVNHRGVLLPGGNLVIKLLEGGGTAAFATDLRKSFARLVYARPAATRRESRETYLVGLGRR